MCIKFAFKSAISILSIQLSLDEQREKGFGGLVAITSPDPLIKVRNLSLEEASFVI